MQETLANLLDLSRLDGDVRQQRHIELPEATAEVMRRLRDAAEASKVRVHIDGHLPSVEVNAAAVELVLTNYISNGIKYADPKKAERKVQVSADIRELDDGCLLVVSVRDNGLGVPPEARERLFERFFRAHETVTGVEGTGLGLNIVRETVESMGGSAWAEFPDDGSVFYFSIPCRRRNETVAAGTEEAMSAAEQTP
jgi:signal transduction histidine kinase